LEMNQDLIEELAAEPVHVELIQQAMDEENMLHRMVKLVGTNSGKTYCFANSQINLPALPPKLQDTLMTGNGGLGRLLQAADIHMEREILARTVPSDEEIRRDYIIRSGDDELARISETFYRASF